MQWEWGGPPGSSRVAGQGAHHHSWVVAHTERTLELTARYFLRNSVLSSYQGPKGTSGKPGKPGEAGLPGLPGVDVSVPSYCIPTSPHPCPSPAKGSRLSLLFCSWAYSGRKPCPDRSCSSSQWGSLAFIPDAASSWLGENQLPVVGSCLSSY